MKLIRAALVLAIATGLRQVPAAPSPTSPEQTKEGRQLEFEAASIKPYRSADRPNFSGGNCHGIDSKFGPNAPIVPPLGRCILIGNLTKLVNVAYDSGQLGLTPDGTLIGLPISGSPNWADSDRFEIEAKAEDSTATEAQLKEMLKNLLADRFKLKFHWETKGESGYGLVVAKGGPKFGKTADPNSRPSFQSIMDDTTLKVTARNYSLSALVDAISRMVQRPAVDMTQLTGKYDFKLTCALDRGPSLGGEAEPSVGPSIFTALQEQLGLKLETRKVAVQVFVIDHAEKP